MVKKITLLFCLIYLFTCTAQSGYTAIDTANVAWRNKLKAAYNQRVAQTLLSFKNLPDKSYSKDLAASYAEINTEFTDKVNRGQFVQGPYYEDQINALLKKIASANPEYASLASAQILLSFAETPNAYAMGDGFVVVNLPLFANVYTEDEVAFILCHELAHNLLNHPRNGLLEYVKLKNSSDIKKRTREIEKQKYNKGETASNLFKKIVYANRKRHREVEFQADSLGFVLYKNAFAGKESAALKSFITLDDMDREKDSLLPVDYEKLFSSDKQPFNKEWILGEEISKYKYDKTLKFWQIDSLKTHPDCADRAKRLQTVFKIGTENTEDPLPAYQDVVKRAKYDHLMGLFVLKEYGKSLYQSLLLLKYDPDNAYLRGMVHDAFLKIQEAQKNYTMNKYVDTMSPRYSYSYNTFLSFVRQLRKSEISEIINQYSVKK